MLLGLFAPTHGAWVYKTEMLKERVPLHVQELVGKKIRRRRAQLKEVAVPAATLDDLVHSEAIERLADASSVHGKSVGGDLNEDDRPIKLVHNLLY